MDQYQAARLIGASVSNSLSEIEAAYERAREGIEQKIVQAPTPALKNKLRAKLGVLDDARQTLESSLALEAPAMNPRRISTYEPIAETMKSDVSRTPEASLNNSGTSVKGPLYFTPREISVIFAVVIVLSVSSFLPPVGISPFHVSIWSICFAFFGIALPIRLVILSVIFYTLAAGVGFHPFENFSGGKSNIFNLYFGGHLAAQLAGLTCSSLMMKAIKIGSSNVKIIISSLVGYAAVSSFIIIAVLSFTVYEYSTIDLRNLVRIIAYSLATSGFAIIARIYIHNGIGRFLDPP